MHTIPVANHLISTAYRHQDDDDLTPLRIQKLMYFLHGWYMAVTGTALLSEPFVHGQYGPKLKILDEALTAYAGVPVDELLLEWHEGEQAMAPYTLDVKAVPQLAEVTEKVWAEYSRFSTAQLSTMSHGPESPWARTKDGDNIPNTWIVEEFVRLGAANRARTSASAIA